MMYPFRWFLGQILIIITILLSKITTLLRKATQCLKPSVIPFSVFRPAECPRIGETNTRQRRWLTESLTNWFQLLKGRHLLYCSDSSVTKVPVYVGKLIFACSDVDTPLPTSKG